MLRGHVRKDTVLDRRDGIRQKLGRHFRHADISCAERKIHQGNSAARRSPADHPERTRRMSWACRIGKIADKTVFRGKHGSGNHQKNRIEFYVSKAHIFYRISMTSTPFSGTSTKSDVLTLSTRFRFEISYVETLRSGSTVTSRIGEASTAESHTSISAKSLP